MELTRATRESNTAYWPAGEAVPQYALTMGVAPTLSARQILLLARGPDKADALARALQGPIDGQAPCSLLRLAPRLTVIADTAALTRMAPARVASDE